MSMKDTAIHGLMCIKEGKPVGDPYLNKFCEYAKNRKCEQCERQRIAEDSLDFITAGQLVCIECENYSLVQEPWDPEESMPWCKEHKIPITPDFYCKDAKRKREDPDE